MSLRETLLHAGASIGRGAAVSSLSTALRFSENTTFLGNSTLFDLINGIPTIESKGTVFQPSTEPVRPSREVKIVPNSHDKHS